MNFLNVIGLSVGFIGAVILAFSLSSIISMLSLLVAANELDAESSGEMKTVGLDRHFNKSKKVSGAWTTIGLVFLAVGFALQIVAAFASK